MSAAARSPASAHTVVTRSARRAASFIRRGQLAAFPTETVYGLGADAFNEAAIARIFAAKGRPADNPLIAHIASLDQLPLLARQVPPAAQRLIDAFFPGPLTLVLPKHPAVPLLATAGLDTLGIRMPADAAAQDFLRACGTPVVAPSANRSGRPSPTTWQAVREDLDGRIDCILRGEEASFGLESTVVDCTGRTPEVLRSGAITLEQLREVIPAIRIHRPRRNGPARSPGLRHRHYAPHAQVVLVETLCDAPRSRRAAYIGMRPPLLATGFGLVALCRDPEQYARTLFRFFRECDAAGLATIYCETLPEHHIGRALMDRLRRAAAR